MLETLLALIILIASAGPALLVLSRLGCHSQSPTERFVLACMLGLGLAAYTVFIFGLIGWLYPAVFFTIISLSFILSVRPVGRLGIAAWRDIFAEVIHSGGLLERTCLLAIGIVSLFSFAGALAPPVGHDELCYHLTHPKLYVQHHQMIDVRYASSCLWPYLSEMLFTLGLLLKGHGLAKLFHFIFYLLTGAGVYVFARRVVPDSKKAAFYGMTTYLLTPVAFDQAAFAYVDNTLACYCLATFFAFYIYNQSKASRWLFVSGLFAGFAASAKIIGLFVLPVMTATLFYWALRRSGLKDLVKSLSVVWAGFLITGSAFYLRSYLLRGNPVFPFYPEWFQGSGWQDPTYNTLGRLPKSVWTLVLLPWDITVHRDWFDGANAGGLYLAVLPLVILWAFKNKGPIRFVLWMGFGYTLLWFVINQNTRFFVPALAVFSVAVGWGIRMLLEMPSRFHRGVSTFILASFLGLQTMIAVAHFTPELKVLLGRLQENDYLAIKEPSAAMAAEISSKLKPSDVILAVGENRGYYFSNELVMEGDFNRFEHYAENRTAAQAVEFIKSKGITHALVAYREDNPLYLDSQWRLAKMIREERIRQAHFKLLYELRRPTVRYELYEIL